MRHKLPSLRHCGSGTTSPRWSGSWESLEILSHHQYKSQGLEDHRVGTDHKPREAMKMSSSQGPKVWFHKRQRAGFSKDDKTGMVFRSFAEPFGGAIFIK